MNSALHSLRTLALWTPASMTLAWRKLAVALAFPLVLLQASPASAGVPPLLARDLKRGQVRMAHRNAVDQLTTNPDDPDLHALFGAVLSKAGYYSDSVNAFTFAQGSEWYDVDGMPYHADALRHAGYGKEAALLRKVILDSGPKKSGWSITVLINLVDDYRAAKDMSAAWETADQLLGWYPGSPLTWATIADLYIDEGDLDSAWMALFEGDRMIGRTSFRTHLVRARLFLAEGLFEEAWAATEAVPRGRYRDYSFWAFKAEIQRQEGFPEDAVMTIEQDRFKYQNDPDMSLVLARSYRDMGDLDRAREIALEAARFYPARTDVVGLAEELRSNVPKPEGP